MIDFLKDAGAILSGLSCGILGMTIIVAVIVIMVRSWWRGEGVICWKCGSVVSVFEQRPPDAHLYKTICQCSCGARFPLPK